MNCPEHWATVRVAASPIGQSKRLEGVLFNWREFSVFAITFVLVALIILLLSQSLRITLALAGFFIVLWIAYVCVYLIFSRIFGRKPFDLMKIFVDEGGGRRGPRRSQEELRIRQGRVAARDRERSRGKPRTLAARGRKATSRAGGMAKRFKRSRPDWRDEDKWGIND